MNQTSDLGDSEDWENKSKAVRSYGWEAGRRVLVIADDVVEDDEIGG